jgi:ribulose-bisphosphate carboxylase large chain
MRVIAKIIRIIGFDQLHVGAAIGKMAESRREALENCEALRGEMDGVKAALPVASGGLHPGLVPELIQIFGWDIVIQAGGGIHGHGEGTIAGARAMRQAVDATIQGVSLEEYAQDHHELKLALEMWGGKRGR